MTAGRKVNSQNAGWGTPRKYVRAVREVFGGRVSLDPCSNSYSIVQAAVEYQLPERDGLRESWDYPTIYVNPPYGRDGVRGTTIKDWLVRCAEANRVYGSEVIALIPVAPNTRHWKDCIFGHAAAICFLYDTRLKFLDNGKESGKGAPMACAAVYWGDNYSEFYEVFIKHGAVVDIRSLRDVLVGPKRMNAQLLLL